MNDMLTGWLARGGVVPLDGGLATTLADRGHDLSGSLWSARLLVDDPDAIRAVHRDFVAAGAEVVTTSSYQLSSRSLSQAGFDPGDVDVLLARSVALAREAVADRRSVVGRRPLVAASVGPYGAVLGGGAEYRGRYGLSVADLRRFHAPRLDALLDAGPDLLACETLPSGDEVTALTDLLRGCGVPAWVTTTLGPDGVSTPEGQPLRDALLPALTVAEVVAVGVNCCDPDLTARALQALDGVDRPLVAYPNVGATWDPDDGAWRRDPDRPPPAPVPWVEAGAGLIGGCCGTTPEDLAALLAALDGHPGAARRT